MKLIKTLFLASVLSLLFASFATADAGKNPSLSYYYFDG